MKRRSTHVEVLPIAAVQDGERGFEIFPGMAGGKLFAKKPRAFDIPMPPDPDAVTATDLNDDGLHDIVMRHADGALRRIVVALAQRSPGPSAALR